MAMTGSIHVPGGPPAKVDAEPTRASAPPGPGRRRQRIRPESLLFIAAAVVLLALVIVPLILLLAGSLSRTFGEIGQNLTFNNYSRIYTDTYNYKLLRNTLVVTSLATVFSLTIGVIVAWLIGRANLPTRRALEILMLVPLFVSPFYLALGWGIAIGPTGAVGKGIAEVWSDAQPSFDNLFGIIFVITLSMVPYAYLFVSASFRNMDPSLEEAARMSGMGTLQTARRVTIPLAKPAILSAALLTFIEVAGQFGVPLIYGVPAGIFVITTRLYTMTQNAPSDLEGAAALSTMMIVISIIAMYVQIRALGEGAKRFATVTGRGFRPSRVKLGKSVMPALTGVWIYVILASVIPVGSLVYTAFLPRGSSVTDYNSLTFDNIRSSVFENDRIKHALTNSLVYSGIAATIVVVLAAVIAWLRVRSKTRGAFLLDFVSMVPAAIPGIVLALAFLWTFVRTPLYGTMWILVLGYVAAFLPFALRAIAPGINAIDPTLEEAGRMSGLAWLRRFTRILLPLLRPNLIAAWLLCFTIFFKELPISIMLSSLGHEVLSVSVYSAWSDGRTDHTAAIATVQIAVIGIVVGLVNLLRRE
jgi:iron(III) transport system permease protein